MTQRPLLLLIGLAGCAQIQAQRPPSWVQAENSWTAERLVCMGHSGSDGGVRAADYAAARCAAGYARGWLAPAIASAVEDGERRQQLETTLMGLAKVTDRYTDLGSGAVTSRLVLTAAEMDRQLQREFDGEPEPLERVRAALRKGPAESASMAPTEPTWIDGRWSPLRQAALPQTEQGLGAAKADGPKGDATEAPAKAAETSEAAAKAADASKAAATQAETKTAASKQTETTQAAATKAETKNAPAKAAKKKNTETTKGAAKPAETKTADPKQADGRPAQPKADKP